MDGNAFLPREKDDYLSVFCLDMIEGGDVESRIEYLKRDIPPNTGSNGKPGVVNVATMKELAESEENRKLTVTHEPVDCRDERLRCDYRFQAGIGSCSFPSNSRPHPKNGRKTRTASTQKSARAVLPPIRPRTSRRPRPNGRT